MKKYKRIIVALDNSDFDKKLLHYFDQFCDFFPPEKIYFTYVDKNLELPPNFDITYKDENGNPIPKDEMISKIVGHNVKTYFGSRHAAEVSVNVLEGSPLKELLHWANVKDADLLVMGNKKHSEGSGVVAKRIARNTKAAVLFVPETSRENIKKILVPIDFSERSRIAMEGALAITSELPKAEITCFNVFDVPLSGYPTINMNYEKFVKNMATFKQEAFDKYIQQFDLEGAVVKTDYVENSHNSPARHINEYANSNQFDLVVMAAKGHNAFERILIGSVTEKLLTLDKEVPVLVLRLNE